ncbi:hypothetical protein CQW23_03530 [Capsicum baccatum]|uniref:Uncharacterized protein n=1 Tax=Capsicum baccatum TaxID=33114 RepID=A0A2G2XC23_CAPBA|nr:hypothetical protein CQW23_03530 [Capsicum baccatum]
MSESPCSSQRMTQSQSQKLFGACKDQEKNISKGKEKVDECVVVIVKKKKQIREKMSATLNEYHSGDNMWLKNNDTHAGNPIGVNLSTMWERKLIVHLRESGNKLSVNLVDDVEQENIDVGDHIDVGAEDHLSDNVIDDVGQETVGVGDRIDADAGDKSTVILDDTPVVPHRIGKPTAICETPYVSKFDSGCSNIQGQPTKCIDKGHSRKYIFSIKHPFTISITEPFHDMKLLSSFNKFVDKSLQLNSNPVYSKSVNNLSNAFDFGVVTIKIKEWFYTVGYAGVPLTDSIGGSTMISNSFVRMCYIISLESGIIGNS